LVIRWLRSSYGAKSATTPEDLPAEEFHEAKRPRDCRVRDPDSRRGERRFGWTKARTEWIASRLIAAG
jgi:hypothetical protein